MSMLKRVKNLEKVYKLTQGEDYLLVIKPKGMEIRGQFEEETLREYMSFLDEENIKYVYCKL